VLRSPKSADGGSPLGGGGGDDVVVLWSLGRRLPAREIKEVRLRTGRRSQSGRKTREEGSLPATVDRGRSNNDLSSAV
jgi:hypothetical protein